MARACRINVIAAMVAHLDGAVVDEQRDCPDAATYRVSIVRFGDGWDVEVWAEVCPAHEQQVSLRDDSGRPTKLRHIT
jgi:hypothetical protein